MFKTFTGAILITAMITPKIKLNTNPKTLIFNVFKNPSKKRSK